MSTYANNRRPTQGPLDDFSYGDSNGDSVMPEVLPPSAVEAQERALVDTQIATAKRYGRVLHKVTAKMKEYALLDQETAAACFYTLKRKDADGTEKIIQGPSVRLAEIAVACYQNIRAGARLIDNDGKKITCQGICIDLENNVAVTMEVQQRITTRSGKTYGEDMQIIAANAASAKAFRNAVFKVIPGALITPVYEAAKKVAVGTGAMGPRWQKAINAFRGYGVTEKQLLTWLEKVSVAEIVDEDIARLIGLFNALKEGEQKVEEAFHGIAPDGTRYDNEGKRETSQQEQPKQEDPKPESDQPSQHTDDTKPEPPADELHGESNLDAVGPFTIGDFANGQQLFEAAVALGTIKTRAQFDGLLSKTKGTKRQLLVALLGNSKQE